MKEYAKYVDYKELYEKVVPPVQLLESESQNAIKEVQEIRRVVARFDDILSQKANKPDLIRIDNKFRNFSKHAMVEKFKQVTTDEICELRLEVK